MHELVTTIKLLGYFVARKTKKQEPGDDGQMYDVIYFTLHPKYIIDVTDKVYGTDGVLYHLTLKKNLKKIQEKGFIPRNSGTYGDDYPDRVYFFFTNGCPADIFFQSKAAGFAQYLKTEYEQRVAQAEEDYEAGRISKQKRDYIVSHREDYRDWVVLKVDVKDRRSYIQDDRTTMYRFFDDPRSPGIFTYENIDP